MAKKISSKISNLQSLRILIVEDSEDDALLIIRELKKGGYDPVYERVETATAMKKALKEKQWDIILCDYNLPKFNAPLALVVLKETNIDIPIIIASGTIGEDVAVECMRLGAQDYIMKNNLSRLCPAIARELEEAKVRNKQKQTEEALRQSEEKYRSIIENMQEGYFENDLAGNFTFVNDALCRTIGYPREELIGKNNRQYTDEKTAKTIYQVYNRIYRTGEQSKWIEEEYVRKDGIKVYAELSVSLISDAEGKPIGFRGIARDITERKQAEDALRMSEENFRRSLDDSSLGVRIVTAEGETLYVNQATLEIYGYDNIEELERTSIKAHYTPESYADFQIRNEKRRRGEFGPSEYEINIVRKNGEIRHIRVFRKDVIWNGARQFQIIYHDITQHKQAEESLRKSEAQYRLLANNMKDQLWLMDLNLKPTYISPSVERARGYTFEEIAQLPLDKQLTATSLQSAMEFFSIEMPKALADPTYYMTRLLELEFCCKDGSTLWVENTFSLIWDENGKPLSLLGLGRDITERKQAEEESRQNIERMRKALRATVQSICMTVEMKDPYTAGHQQRVSDLARSIATEMGLSADRRDFIRTASSIHDIGKIAIPSEILSKPTKLTDLEFNLIKTHSQSGYDILKDIEFPWPVADVVLQHHERMDGSGYPHGLKGDDILLEARILAIADVVEAIASHRPYRPALGINLALEEISQNKGSLYDADAVDACLKLFREKGYTLVIKKS